MAVGTRQPSRPNAREPCIVRAEHVASLGPSRARRSCKYSPGDSGGPGDSASLKACNDLLMEYMPKLKALPKASITRQVCGGCMDFKVSITQPLDEHGAFMGDLALEEEFMGKLKAIDGTSQHETQEITFVEM